MTENRKLPEAIQWHEGMLLSPQHFQQMDVRLEAMLLRQRQHFLPYHWGVQHWELDETALVDGVFRLMALDAVLPDGLLLNFRDQTDQRLEIDLSENLETLRSKPQKIWLAVPAHRGDVSWTNHDLPRYRSVGGESVVDLNRGQDGVPIPRLRPFISLHIEKPAKVFSYLPLAEVTNQKGTLSLTDFCAPCLSVPVTSQIWEMCNDLKRTLRHRIKSLSATLKTERGSDPTRVAELEQKLYHFAAGLPQFEVLLNQTPPHPLLLYQSLNQLAGHLAALGESRVPKVPPLYDHNDPLIAFKAVFDDLKDKIDRQVSESWVAIYFQKKTDRYAVHFKEEWLQRELVIGMVRGSLTEQDASRWLEHSVIGLSCELEEMRESRVEGLDRNPVERVKGMVPTKGTSLFTLEPVEGFLKPDEELVVMPVTRESNIWPSDLILYIK